MLGEWVSPVSVGAGLSALIILWFAHNATRRTRRVPFLFGLTFAWLTMGMYVALPFSEALRSGVIIPFTALAVAAHKQSTGQVARLAYGFVAAGVLAVLYATGAGVDFASPWVAYVFAALAALAVSAYVQDPSRVVPLLRAMVVGLAVGLAPTVLVLALNPSAAFSEFGRLGVYSANPNTLGPSFAIVAVLSLHFFILHRGKAWLILAVLSGSMGGLTLSRGSALFLVAGVLPLGGLAIKNRRVMTRLVIVFFLLGLPLLGYLDRLQPSRLLGGQADMQARWHILRQYMEAVNQRPLVGVLFGPGPEALSRDHSHNAYMEWLLLGGWPLLGFVAVLTVSALVGGLRMVRSSRSLGLETNLAAVVLALFVASILHGLLVTRMIFHPTHAVAFFHLTAATWCLAWGARAGMRRVDKVGPVTVPSERPEPTERPARAVHAVPETALPREDHAADTPLVSAVPPARVGAERGGAPDRPLAAPDRTDTPPRETPPASPSAFARPGRHGAPGRVLVAKVGIVGTVTIAREAAPASPLTADPARDPGPAPEDHNPGTPLIPTSPNDSGPPGQVDINTARPTELQRIVHIGPDRAHQIIAQGPFATLDELAGVPGITETRLRDIKAQGVACCSCPPATASDQPSGD